MITIPGGALGDITGVTAGDGLSGGGDSGALTVTLDLNELTAASVADGDFIPIIDTNDSNGSRKEAVHDLATLFSGDGLAATSSVMAVDLGTNPGLEFSSNKLQIAKGISQHDVAQFGAGVVDNDFLRVDGTTIEGRSASEVLSDIGGAALSGSTDNTVATVTGANALAGEANLTFDGSTLAVTGAVTISTDLTVSGGDIVYGNGQNATASVTATAHDAAGRNLTITAGPTTAGTSNNQAGGALTLQGGQGKGSGAGGDIIFQTANASGSGSSLNSLATALTLSDDLSATFAGAVDLGSNTLTSTGSMQIRTIDYSDGDLSMTIADGGGVTFAQNIQTADIELGHASDTTLSRSASGVVTIEGNIITTVGTENIWVPAAAMTPRDNAGCAALATVAAGTNGRPDFHVLDFDKDSDEHAQFTIAMPKSWDGGNVYYYVYWIGIAATTGVTWGLQVLSLNDNEEFNQAYGTAVMVDDDSQGDVTELLISAKSGAIACSGADNDLLCFQVYRDVSAGNDDMAGDARLWGLLLEYTTNAATDA